MKRYQKSQKLNGILYDIRGPVLEEAERLETGKYITVGALVKRKPLLWRLFVQYSL